MHQVEPWDQEWQALRAPLSEEWETEAQRLLQAVFEVSVLVLVEE